MTNAQKDEIWRRWRTGESLSDIGCAVGKFHASIFGLLRLYGGFTPPARHRAPPGAYARGTRGDLTGPRPAIPRGRAPSRPKALPAEIGEHSAGGHPGPIWNGTSRPRRPMPNWGTDIRTAEHWLYLCVVLDLYSGLIVGWSMTPRQDRQFVIQAVLMAV